MSDFDFEPAPGLPEKLPPGECMLWQGAPHSRAIARRVFHIRLVTAYFGLMIAWQIVEAVYDRSPVAPAAIGVAWMSGLALLCCGILALLAMGIARTTIYTLTSERLIMRYGIALPITLNIPFSKVEAAAARIGPDGNGDIPLTLMKGEKIAYAVLWPHARPWRMKRPEPTLRCIPNAAEVASTLARALAAAASRPDARAATAPSADVRSLRPAPGTAEPAPSEGRRIASTA